MKIYPVFIPHAGCPHRCLFCAQERSTSSSTVPEPKAVEAWLDASLPLQSDGEVAFYGGTFSLLPSAQQEAYLSAAQGFVRARRISGIRISTRPDALDVKALARLKTFAVTTVELGCQSFDDEVLQAAGRGHRAADNISAIKACHSAGFNVGVQLMPGLPGSDAGEAVRSLQQVLKLKPLFIRVYPTVVVAGTGLAELWRAGGYQPWTLDSAVEVCADMLQLCCQANIPVIRIGLQHDPQLAANLLAGPYHAAFGQLVRSRLWRRAMLHVGSPEELLTVHPSDLSDALGHRGENREWLGRTYPGLRLQTDRTVARGCLRMSGQELSFLDWLPQGGLNG